MPEIKINLTADEKKAWDEMLGDVSLEDYLKAIATTHEEGELDKKWKSKSKAEKKALMGG